MDTDAADGTATSGVATDDGATSSRASTGTTTVSADEADGSGSADSGDSTGGGGPTANERCTPFCDELVATNCDNGLTTEGCLLWCESLTSAQACEATAHEYFDCVDGETLVCNGAGDAVAPGCAVDYLVAIECAVTENPNPAIVEPCMEHCGLIQDAACPNNGELDQCLTNCLWSGNTGLGCDGEWTTYVECFNQSNVSCVLGFAIGEGCGPDYQAYLACLNDPT